MAAPPCVLVLVNETSTLPFTGTDKLRVPPSLAVLLCALMLKWAAGPDWKLSTTVPVAVEVWLLLSVTVSVIVLLAVPKLKVQVEEFPQIAVPLLFQAWVVIAAPPCVLVLVNETSTLPFTGTDRLRVPPSLAVLLCALILKWAAGPDWKLSTTVPVAVEVWLLLSVTVSVIVLLAVPKLNVQVEEFPQMAVPLLFQA